MEEKFLDKIPINKLYDDLFHPGMKKAGEALETVLDAANLILLPLKLINSKSRIFFQKNIEKYSEKINNVEKLNSVRVPEYVGLPIIDKLTYLNGNELAETFINLLTKASFEETLNLVHPAYISILNRLSVDEAKILFHFKNNTRIPFIDIYVHRYIEKIKKPEFYDKQGAKSREQLKQLLAYNTQDRQSTFMKGAWNLTGIENRIKLLFPKNIDIYIENLKLNGLITFERTLYNSIDSDIYDKLINEDYKKEQRIIKENLSELKEKEYKTELDIRKCYIEFTELGRGFLEACIKDIE